MNLSIGQTMPDAQLVTIGTNGPELVDLNAYIKGRRVVIFGLPGAFTVPCTSQHLPSFIENKAAFDAAGVDEIICIAVNDPFALNAWAETTGAKDAGITMLGDASGELTKSLGMEFTAPQIGLYGRSNRYALLAEDGVVKVLQVDEPDTCDVSKGAPLLAAMRS